MAATIGVVDLADSARQISGHRLAGQPILTRTIRQMTESMKLDKVVAILSSQDRKHLISLIPGDVEIFECDEPDALGRLAATAAAYDAEAIVRVRQNCPFVDPVLIDNLISAASCDPQCDYISYCSNDGRPAATTEIGLFAEWCRGSAICSADLICHDDEHRQHGTSYFYANPQRCKLRLIPAPTSIDCEHLHLAVGSREDFERLEEMVEALGSENLGWQAIVGFVDTHPNVCKATAASTAMVK